MVGLLTLFVGVAFGFGALILLIVVFFRGRPLLSFGVGNSCTISGLLGSVSDNGSSQVLCGFLGNGETDLARAGATCFGGCEILVAGFLNGFWAVIVFDSNSSGSVLLFLLMWASFRGQSIEKAVCWAEHRPHLVRKTGMRSRPSCSFCLISGHFV